MTIINKILKEQHVLDCDIFHIVYDKYPICSEHILALTKQEFTCSLNEKVKNLEILFEKMKDYYSGKYLFFERGNASFCTSIDGPHWSHIHFVPEYLFENNIIDKLAKELNAHPFNILDKEDCYCSEYLLFGDSKRFFYKDIDFKIPKRLIRTFLQHELIPNEKELIY